MKKEYTLFQGHASPYVRLVRILLEELNLMDQIEIIEGLDPTRLKDHPNPLVKIPTLITPDAGLLYDSRVIAEYLDHKFAAGKYIPKNFHERLQVMLNHALAVGAIEATVTIVYEKRRPIEKQYEEQIVKQRNKVVRSLEALSKKLDHFTKNWCIDTIMVVCFIDYLSFRFPGEYDAYPGYKELKEWRLSLKNPIVDKTNPKL